MLKRIKHIIIGGARSATDRSVHEKLLLVAVLAWVGLGADPLSSSCYGPEEAFRILHAHPNLAIFVGLATALTIFIISASYIQIIKLFPTGGGGYLVGSKLLSPKAGLVSGCALLIDYMMTITLSVASGAAVLFSFLPDAWYQLKLPFAIFVVIFLTLLNMRGVKESVIALLPIFAVFLLTHAFAIIYACSAHITDFSNVAQTTLHDVKMSGAELGFFGTMLLLFKAYSMGAGTFTGLEAVSNGIPVLSEPKVETATRTMHYMAWSLSLVVIGLMLAYAFYNVAPQTDKTLNAVLFERIASSWGQPGHVFVIVTLISEAALLFVAAQTGFIDGPRIMGNMALDKWLPTRFSLLSDRLVMQNGIILMGAAGVLIMLLSRGSVHFLIVLYSINVFITFCLSQLGMVKHWWQVRMADPKWRGKCIINGIGLTLTTCILITVITAKFFHGGWVTLLLTGSLVLLAMAIKRHYKYTSSVLTRLDDFILSAIAAIKTDSSRQSESLIPVHSVVYNPQGKTAIIMVNGFTGLGFHTIYNILHIFGETYKNFVFLQVGLIDSGGFKGIEEIDRLRDSVQDDLQNYVEFMKGYGYYAEGFCATGIDVAEEVDKLAKEILKKYPEATFFGGQVVFPNETPVTRFLHNQTVFIVQRRLYNLGVPFVILPIRV
ncbi:MAG: APC family permease [Candidatus Ratteibacteria bacterium]|jgi:amino acid transporter